MIPYLTLFFGRNHLMAHCMTDVSAADIVSALSLTPQLSNSYPCIDWDDGSVFWHAKALPHAEQWLRTPFVVTLPYKLYCQWEAFSSGWDGKLKAESSQCRWFWSAWECDICWYFPQGMFMHITRCILIVEEKLIHIQVFFRAWDTFLCWETNQLQQGK